MNCPGCSTFEMVVEKFPANYGLQVEIDICHGCGGLWFDGRESMQLSPGSTLRLFKAMHEKHAASRPALSEEKSCPRCSDALKETSDLVRNTRFTYFRCESHGRFITFFQWLREKGLVRAPNPKELAALVAQVKVVNCSNCGAPVPLDKTTVCEHCRAPISILASEAIEKTLKDLQAKEIDRLTFKPERLAEAMMVKQRLEAQDRQDRMLDAFGRPGLVGHHHSWKGDLVLGGVGLLLEAAFGLLG